MKKIPVNPGVRVIVSKFACRNLLKPYDNLILTTLGTARTTSRFLFGTVRRQGGWICRR